jgi:putative transposase
MAKAEQSATGEKRRRFFSAEFKLEAVRRAEQRRAAGVPLTQIARELGVTDDLLRSWRREAATRARAPPADVFPGQGRLPGEEEELRRLRREVARLQQENAFLKSAARTSRGSRDERQVRRDPRAPWAVPRAAHVRGAWRQRQRLLRRRGASGDAAVGPRRRRRAPARPRAGGAPEEPRALRRPAGAAGAPGAGHRRRHEARRTADARRGAGRPPAAQVRADHGLGPRGARRAQPVGPALRRERPPRARSRVVPGLDYIPTREGWVFLAVLLDLARRRVVGRATGVTLPTTLPLAALHQALRLRRPAPGLVHHTDRGSQYASAEYRAVLAAHSVRQSTSRTGDCWDTQSKFQGVYSPSTLTRA